MKNFLIIANNIKDKDYKQTDHIRSYLEATGCTCSVALGEKAELPEEPEDIEGVLVLGGDGTLLRATHNTDAKIVGINAGSVGFLTAIERDSIKEGIARLRSGDYKVERRTKIRVTCDGEVLGDAINEALVHTDSVAKIRQFRVYIDDSLFTVAALEKGRIK